MSHTNNHRAKQKRDITEYTLEELKEELGLGGYEEGNDRLNYLNDQVNEKLLEVLKLKKENNRLAIVMELPKLLVLYKKRHELKPYSYKMRMKIRALKTLYMRRNDKAYMDKLDAQVEKKFKKHLTEQKIKDDNIKRVDGVTSD